MALRGDFEGMYRDIEDPWGCSQEAGALSKRLFLEILFEKGTFRRILDIGCGKGDFTNALCLRNGGGLVVGWDVAASAVEQAKTRFSHLVFETRNILGPLAAGSPVFDLVVLSEVLWYILDDLDGVFGRIDALLSQGGVFGVHQYFPREQGFGRDVIDGLEGFAEFLEKRTILRVREKWLREVADGWVLLAAFEKKGSEINHAGI